MSPSPTSCEPTTTPTTQTTHATLNHAHHTKPHPHLCSLRIITVDNLPPAPSKLKSSLSIQVTLYHGGKKLSETVQTTAVYGDTSIRWKETLNFRRAKRDIPKVRVGCSGGCGHWDIPKVRVGCSGGCGHWDIPKVRVGCSGGVATGTYLR